MDSAAQGNLKMVQLFVGCGTDVNGCGRGGQTALIVAVGRKNTEIALALIKAGADRLIKDELGMSAVDYARLFKLNEVLLAMDA